VTTYTLYSQAETNNAMGRVKSNTIISSTITGFLHKITPQDKLFIDLGVVSVGDGVFFAAFDVSINENDEIKESGVTDERWKFTKKVDNEKIQGNAAYQAWACTKRST